jgi:hypothetical protein
VKPGAVGLAGGHISGARGKEPEDAVVRWQHRDVAASGCRCVRWRGVERTAEATARDQAAAGGASMVADTLRRTLAGARARGSLLRKWGEMWGRWLDMSNVGHPTRDEGRDEDIDCRERP